MARLPVLIWRKHKKWHARIEKKHGLDRQTAEANFLAIVKWCIDNGSPVAALNAAILAAAKREGIKVPKSVRDKMASQARTRKRKAAPKTRSSSTRRKRRKRS